MPTHNEEESFQRDWAALSREQRRLFATAVQKMVADLKAHRGFRKGLRVKGIRRLPGVYEMTWADNGRATFTYGTSPNPGDVHVVWRHIGTHDILQNP